MDLFTFLLCKKKGGGGGDTYTLAADQENKQITLTSSKGDVQSVTVPYATDASTINGNAVPELQNGKIPASYLPSYVDDVEEYATFNDLPNPGESGKIYVVTSTDEVYRWSGTGYIQINQDENNRVTQTEVTTDAAYEVTFAGSTGTTTTTEGVGKNARFTYNPSTRQIRLNGPTTSSKSAINTYIEPSYVKATYQQGFGSLGYSDYQSILDGRYLRLKGSDYRSEHGTAEAEIKINSEAIVHIDQDEEKFRLSTLYGAGRLTLTDGESTPTSLAVNNTDIVLSGTNNTWDGVNTSLKSAFAAIQNNLYIANYNKTASLSSGSNTVVLNMTGYTYNGTDIVNVYVDGLYKVNNTDYTITVNNSTGVASINYTAAAAGTMAIQVIKPKIGFTALTDNNEDNVTDSNGNSIDI